MTNVNEKLLNEIKEQNQQILLLLQSLVASNNEVKENNKKVEDSEIVETLQKKYPLYQDNFPLWSMQSGGMLQFIVWTALENMGLGASLQHYNPLIDAETAKMFNLPVSWKLMAEMPFGAIAAQPDEKAFLPLEDRVKVFK